MTRPDANQAALAMSDPERAFMTYWRVLGGDRPEPLYNYKFDAARGWLLDFAWPELRVAVEIHGGTHNRGRHVRPVGFANDREKMNAAQIAGWIVLEYPADVMERDTARVFSEIVGALEMRKGE